MQDKEKERSTEELIRRLLSATPTQKKQVWDVLTNQNQTRVESSKRNTNLYSITGTARMLGISRNSVYALIRQKRLDVLQISGAPKVVGQSIEEFLSGQRPENRITLEMVIQSKKRYSLSKAKS